MTLLNMNIKDNKVKERAIINAATELFLDKGFASTSTIQIAK